MENGHFDNDISHTGEEKLENGHFDNDISHLVRELSGVIELDDEFNFNEEYTRYLMEKYK
ncbi:MAG: hypothetical protein DRI57_05655 [Deltaproteobacteria bacterium]|nr:MAG: hypothetical protein DRI57_05655 [Deltaproteobacteria bacterium]